MQRLMRLMGLEAVYPKRRLSVGAAGRKVYPYLLRGVAIERVNQVWSTDITYIPMPHGFMYLTAVMDWHSRYVLSWRLSNTLDGEFCLVALEEALSRGCPEVFNTDQGVQFTSASFTGRLEAAGATVSMDGKGRCLDNVFVERLWRTVKRQTKQNPPVCTLVVEVATTDLVSVCPWALLELANWCHGQLEAIGGSATCFDPSPTPSPPRLTAASLLPVPRWEELPTNRREELLRILGRMLTEQVARTTKGVSDEPH